MKITKEQLIKDKALLQDQLLREKEQLDIIAQLLNIKQDEPGSYSDVLRRRYDARDIEWADIYFEIGRLKATLTERTNYRDIRNWKEEIELLQHEIYKLKNPKNDDLKQP